MKNEEYVEEYVNSRGLSESSQIKLRNIFNHYSEFQQMPIHDLIIEADDEEDAGIRWKRRTLKTRLIKYRNHCRQNMLLSSAKTYFNTIKALYVHHEIEVGTLPKWNEKNANVPEPITSRDMLTKDIIREALKVANNVMRPIILTEASSGMTKSDVRSLTVGQFREATLQYHHCNTIQDAVKTMLEGDAEIVPAFHMRRAKNNKYFITFCSPEATRETCKYLVLRDKRNHKYHRPLLRDSDSLFRISDGGYQDRFVEINTALKRPKAGTFNQFRGHMLRKFHATQLEKHGMPRYLVNVLQGKSNNAVDDVYFLEDEETLRHEYLKALEGVLIYTDVKEITRYSPEYQKLKSKYDEKEAEVKEMNSRIAMIEKRLSDIDKQKNTTEELLEYFGEKLQ